MADKPILFSGPMVRALLDGRKTQTRRVLKPQPEFHGGYGDFNDAEEWGWIDEDGCPVSVLDIAPNGYRAGDRLWVREHCALWEGGHQDVVYRADEDEQGWGDLRHDARAGAPWKLRPSIHMPRWASRLTLIVTDVRVQRVQEISREDAIAEGVIPAANSQTIDCDTLSPRDDFRDLWNRLNAKRGFGWDRNPWIVALTFDVHKCNIDAMTCPHCHGTGIVSLPYIAGVAVSYSYCRCEAGRKREAEECAS